MLTFVLLAFLVIAAAAAIVIVRNRSQRARRRHRSRYFSISLTNPEAPVISKDQPR